MSNFFNVLEPLLEPAIALGIVFALAIGLLMVHRICTSYFYPVTKRKVNKMKTKKKLIEVDLKPMMYLLLGFLIARIFGGKLSVDSTVFLLVGLFLVTTGFFFDTFKEVKTK